VELDDIQGLIVRPYAMPCCRCVFLRFSDAVGARTLIGDVLGEITNAQPWTHKPAFCTNVGFSHAGLTTLGLQRARWRPSPKSSGRASPAGLRSWATWARAARSIGMPA
jgi:hypothetical protein